MTDDAGQPMEGSSVPTETDRSVETYETEGGTVLYDAGNPLAWIESSVTITIEDAA